MNLLPKTSKEFSSEEYWNTFFRKREKGFEWYGDYLQLKQLLHKYIKNKDSLLVIGCGNSSLGPDLYSNGITNNMNIDISELVVKQMSKKYVTGQTNGLSFLKMDAMKMGFEDESFTVVLDKGTLDAIMADGGNDFLCKADLMFNEIDRVLKQNGRYLCISLLQPHVLMKLADWFQNNRKNYMLRIQRCFDAEEATRFESEEPSIIFPVFAVICTKFQKNVNFPCELYLNIDVNTKSATVSSIDELKSQIESLQHFAVLEYHLKNKTIPKETEIFLELYNESDQTSPRYSIFILDVIYKQHTMKYAIFIVPNGQESQWLFGTPEGRRELAKMSKTQRLCVVHLNRNHVYENLETVKNELSSKVMEFAPKGLKEHSRGKSIPFLSVGDDVGKRIVKHKGHSLLSGDYVVEDVVLPDSQTFRRLVFMSNPNIIQSEAKLVEVKGRQRIDQNYLSCRHHYALFAGIILQDFNENKSSLSILLIGLGGGCFPTFIQRNLSLNRDVLLDIVEIDSEMVKVAKSWFGFQENVSDKDCVKVNVNIEDGIKFVESKVKDKMNSYDLIMFDVDSKDVEKGLSCPPESFIQKSFLECICNLLRNQGLFVLNLVARNNALKQQIKNDVKCLFSKVYSYEVPQEINEVLYCFRDSPGCVLLDGQRSEAAEARIKNSVNLKKLRDISDVSECIANIKIV